MNIKAIQDALKDKGIDGWLLYDFHNRDHLAYRILENVWLRFTPDVSFPMLVGIAIAVGGGLALYLWRHERTRQLAHEVVGELSRVTWPTKQELSASTLVVIIASIIAAVILGLFDAFWGWFTGVIY